MSPKPNWTVGDFTADSVDTERGYIKEYSIGVVDANQFDGADMSVQVNAAFDYLESEYGGGQVLVPRGEYTLSETIVIPFADSATKSFVLSGIGGLAHFTVDSGISDNIGIQFEPNTSGSVRFHNGIENIAVTDDHLTSAVMEVNDGLQYWAKNLRLSSTNTATMRIDSPNQTAQEHNYQNVYLTSSTAAETKLRLGTNANASNNNYFYGLKITGQSGGGTSVLIDGNDNEIYGFDVGAGDVGIEIQGNRNRLMGRFEAPFGSGNDVVTPVKFTSGADQNEVWTQNSDVRAFSQEGGSNNKIHTPKYRTVDIVHPRGTVVPEHFNTDTSGSGSVSRSFGQFDIETGGTNGSHAMLDYNDEYAVGPNQYFRTTYAGQLVNTSNVRCELGMYRDGDADSTGNSLLFYYDTSDPNGTGGNTWVAQSIDGGSVQRTDTNDGPGGSKSFRIAVNDGDIQYFLDGSLVATHTSIDINLMQPRLRIENKEAANKRFSVELRASTPGYLIEALY